MQDVTSFLAVMAALSTAVQTLVDHVVKKRFAWLDEPSEDRTKENRRHSAIHFITFVVGAALAWSIELTPLAYLSVEAGTFANAVASGLLVSFGGSFFNEALGAVREFKKAQKSVREARGDQSG